MNIEQLTAKKTEYEKALAKHGKEAIAGEFEAFFEEHPKCLGLRWTQYTPYFADGEPCEFGVNIKYGGSIKMEGSSEDAGDNEDGYEDEYSDTIKSGPGKKTLKAFEALGKKIGDDVFRIAFGDHVQVTATRDGFEVEEYDHE